MAKKLKTVILQIKRFKVIFMSLNLDYIAGFFDGEGSVRICIRKAIWNKSSSFGYFFNPHIDCSQKDREILDLIKSELHMGRVDKQKYGFVWIVNKRDDCLKFIGLMKERVLLKRPHFDLLEFFLLMRKPYEVYTKEVCLEVLSLIEKLCHLNSKHSRRTLNRVERIRQEVLQSSYKPEDRSQKISEKARGRKPSEYARMKMSIAAKKRARFRERDRWGRWE